MKKKIVVANWKMNNAFDEADQWLETYLDQFSKHVEEFENVKAILCPPVFLIDYIDSELMNIGFEALDNLIKENGKDIEQLSQQELAELVFENRPIHIGAQDCHYANLGSFTGDVSADMIKKIGGEYVIVGHSERRDSHNETDEVVAAKARSALSSGLTPIICVGENKDVRNSAKHIEFVYHQMMYSIPRDVKFEHLIIAYEPIWAIGTGITPAMAQISEMCNIIKRIVHERMPGLAKEVSVLYGGSVTAENSIEILHTDNVDGVLVGKASLNPLDFVDICLS